MTIRKNEKLTQKELKQMLRYDKKTGNFVWLVNRKNSKKGSLAGSQTKGASKIIFFKGVGFTASRLAFLYVKGSFPENNIKFIDGDKTNIKWRNLEESKGKGDKKFTGVSWMPRLMKWKSKIFMDGKYFVIGYFDEFDDAVKARKQAVIEQIGDCNENDRTSSIGVYFDVKHKKYSVEAMIEGERQFLGYFETKSEGVNAQSKAEAGKSLDDEGITIMNRSEVYKCVATVNGIKKHCGYFDNIIEAIKSRNEMEK